MELLHRSSLQFLNLPHSLYSHFHNLLISKNQQVLGNFITTYYVGLTVN